MTTELAIFHLDSIYQELAEYSNKCEKRGALIPMDVYAAKAEAVKMAMEAGYFKASGDLALCRCPFCGSEDVVYERYLHTAGYRWRVVCTSCMASIDPGHAQQRSTVQRMWNTRAPIL